MKALWWPFAAAAGLLILAGSKARAEHCGADQVKTRGVSELAADVSEQALTRPYPYLRELLEEVKTPSEAVSLAAAEYSKSEALAAPLRARIKEIDGEIAARAVDAEGSPSGLATGELKSEKRALQDRLRGICGDFSKILAAAVPQDSLVRACDKLGIPVMACPKASSQRF